MNGQIKGKYLQHINKKSDRGFTLIELVVVFFIIGIMSAIALPSLLTQTCKAKQSEARQNIGAMNRAQQAYFFEKNQFATSINNLGIGMKTQTENYLYSIQTRENSAFNYATPRKVNDKRRGYVGGVFLAPDTKVEAKADKDEVLTQAVVCETNEVSNAPAANPIYKNGEIICDPTTKNLSP